VPPVGRIKDTPEDFVVEEVPLYEACGQGDHLFVRFTKRDLTTDGVVRALCRAVGCDARDAGVPGMKDKRALTTQTISLPVPRSEGDAFEARVRAVSLPGVEILDCKRHTNKLRTGHLAGNRFTLVVRGIAHEHVGEVIDSLVRVGREGLANAFGAQRFGRDKDNAERARAWLSGRTPAPRDGRLQRLLWSALQSELFNEVLAARVANGTWAQPLLGDLVKRRSSGGLFLCTDVQVDQERARLGEVSPTGPIFGVKMREPEGEPATLERAVLAEKLGDGVDLAKTRRLGEGTRRPLRLWIEDLSVVRLEDANPRTEQEQGASVRVYFVLPKGAYATTVLSTAVQWESLPLGDAAPPSGLPGSSPQGEPPFVTPPVEDEFS
jgi:tRNA pseudouridine13 synthase